MIIVFLVINFISQLFLVKPIYAANIKTIDFTHTVDNISNPERGLLHMTNNAGLSQLQRYRTNEQITLIMINYYLTDFVNRAIDQSTLANIASQLKTARDAGVKVVLRFAYTSSESGSNASLAQIQSHLDQLAPILQANRDIIYVWQAGFIGTWGEWHYTTNTAADFGDRGNISAAQWNNRKLIVEKMRQVLPNTFLSLRTPLQKRTMFGNQSIAETGAFSDTIQAWLGHHNDAFVANSTDYGTYKDKSVEYPYLAAETKYVPMGGENNNYDSARSTCPIALSEMALFHWTYINRDYYIPTLTQWTNQGCLMTMQKQLGYRLALNQAAFDTLLSGNGILNLTFTLSNLGFAPLYYERPIYAVLFNNLQVYKFPLSADPRRWQPGQIYTINQQISLPAALPSGTYKLALWLPDKSPSLQTRPEYAVRLANNNIWDESTGYNIIDSNIEVNNNSNTALPGDVNGDNKVDGIDYVVWLSHFNQNVSGTTSGDFNNSGKVDGVDYVIWLNNYGK